MKMHWTLQNGDGNQIDVWQHPSGREYVVDPVGRDGWFLILHERNGDRRMWRVYAMRPEQDKRTGEPDAAQALEVHEDVWQALTMINSGKYEAG